MDENLKNGIVCALTFVFVFVMAYIIAFLFLVFG